MKIKAALLALALILLFSITPLFVNTASATALREFSGEAGSYSGEYKISTAESLNALAAAVNAGNNMSGVTFYLENDIALNSALEFNENGYVSGSPAVWSPIGTYTEPFSGVFEGNGYTISGVYIKYLDIEYMGLFGYVKGGSVQNLKLSNSVIDGFGWVGGIIGFYEAEGKSPIVTFKNLSVSKSYIYASRNGGGLIGGINVDGERIGTAIQINIDGCRNESIIEGGNDGFYMQGGLIDEINASGEGVKISITNCYNSNSVNGSGIVGKATINNGSSLIIDNCYNSGHLRNQAGIIGRAWAIGGTVIIQNCYNTGSTGYGIAKEVSAQGDTGKSTAIIRNCYNNSGSGSLSGIVGYIGNGGLGDNTATVEYCWNATPCVFGGIAGEASGNNTTIQYCYNLGSINGIDGGSGGIAGKLSGSVKVQYCYNTGALSADTRGGIVGTIYNYDNIVIRNCYNAGTIEGKETLSNAVESGAILGKNLGTGTVAVQNCYYDKNLSPIGAVYGHDIPNAAIGLSTTEMTGTKLENILGEDNWVFTAGLYPRLKGTDTYNMAGSNAAIVSVTPATFGIGDSSAFVMGNISLGTGNGVTWKSDKPNIVKIEGGSAKRLGIDSKGATLTASLNGVSKAIRLSEISDHQVFYKLTIEATKGGAISSGTVYIAKGQSQTFNIKPNNGCALYHIQVDGDDFINKGETYTIFSIKSDHTVKIAFVGTSGWVNPYSDVEELDWYGASVRYVTDHYYMSGTDVSKFEPNLETTRAMMVMILWRMQGHPSSYADIHFRDVIHESWYGAPVAWSVKYGIANGYDEYTFGPNDNVTREQLAAIMYRYAKFRGYDTSFTNSLSNFEDAANISDWATDSMKWAVSKGLINGITATSLEPGGYATRAQLAAIIERFNLKFNN